MTGNGIGDCVLDVRYICLYDWKKSMIVPVNTFDALRRLRNWPIEFV